MEIQYLKENQFAVTSAELPTGIILNSDGTYFMSGSDLKNTFKIFDSYSKAEEFVLHKIKNNPNVECYIADSKENIVIVYDKYGERKK